MSRLPLLIITPHGSGHVPQDVLGTMLGPSRLDIGARRRRLDHLFAEGDPFTDMLFDVPGAFALHATVSRFVVDLNRTRDAGSDNGVVKATDFRARPLYPPGATPDAIEVEDRLQRYWDPFHAEVDRVLRRHDIALLLDGHSMTPRGPAIGPDGGRERPALTLMTGGNAHGEAVDGSPQPTVAPPLARRLRDAVARNFEPVLEAAAHDVPPRVVLNEPWSVDEVSRLHGPVHGVPALGLEINRALYLNDDDADRPDPDRIRALQACVAAFTDEAVRIARRSAPKGAP